MTGRGAIVLLGVEFVDVSLDGVEVGAEVVAVVEEVVEALLADGGDATPETRLPLDERAQLALHVDEEGERDRRYRQRHEHGHGVLEPEEERVERQVGVQVAPRHARDVHVDELLLLLLLLMVLLLVGCSCCARRWSGASGRLRRERESARRRAARDRAEGGGGHLATRRRVEQIAEGELLAGEREHAAVREQSRIGHSDGVDNSQTSRR